MKDKFLCEGFTIEAESEVGLSFSCPLEHFNNFFNINAKREQINFIKVTEYYYHTLKEDIVSPICTNLIERISIQKPLFVLDTISYETKMPKIDYYHLQVPKDVRRVAMVESFYKDNFKGNNINVNMIDTGLYSNHRFYRVNNYKIEKICDLCGWELSIMMG
ncbi:MAG: hypothetical protein AB1422_19140 [bacterium]